MQREVEHHPDRAVLLERIRQLEDTVETLRVGRRILMGLVQEQMRQKGALMAELSHERRKAHRRVPDARLRAPGGSQVVPFSRSRQ